MAICTKYDDLDDRNEMNDLDDMHDLHGPNRDGELIWKKYQ